MNDIISSFFLQKVRLDILFILFRLSPVEKILLKCQGFLFYCKKEEKYFNVCCHSNSAVKRLKITIFLPANFG